MYAEDVRQGNGIVFSTVDIPTSKCAIHEYHFDWNALRDGKNGMEVRIDQNCDGIFETSLKSDLILTADEFARASSKITICHIPPGNPDNQHEITVGSSALKAHLTHGDHEGPCKSGDKDGEKENNKKDTFEKENTKNKKSEKEDEQQEKSSKNKK